MHGNQSEVARLIQQIGLECEAAHLAMHGYAEVARHETITARMENMGRLHEELRQLVGDEKAAEALVGALDGSKARAVKPEPRS